MSSFSCELSQIHAQKSACRIDLYQHTSVKKYRVTSNWLDNFHLAFSGAIEWSCRLCWLFIAYKGQTDSAKVAFLTLLPLMVSTLSSRAINSCLNSKVVRSKTIKLLYMYYGWWYLCRSLNPKIWKNVYSVSIRFYA